MIKLCKDCKFLVPSTRHGDKGVRWGSCSRIPESPVEVNNLVTGKANDSDTTQYAACERIGGWLYARIEGKCGEEGRFFQRK